jgi:3-phenylpropionate/trans-cinnamate dioxygenase ferredoxin component
MAPLPDFIRLCPASDIAEGQRKVFEVDSRFVVVFDAEGGWYAIDDCCTHDGGPLGQGKLDGFTVTCPRHGATFDIRDGRALTMPAVGATTSHQVKVEGGDVLLRLAP